MAMVLVWGFQMQVVIAEYVSAPGHAGCVAIQDASNLLLASSLPYVVHLAYFDHDAALACDVAVEGDQGRTVLRDTGKDRAVIDDGGGAL